MAIIALEGMQFFAHHGVFESEKIEGNTFEVDVWLEDLRPLPSDDQISSAIDYGRFFEIVQRVMSIRKNLLESLVLEIGHQMRTEFPEAVSIRVRVAKLNPPVNGVCKRSFVEQKF